MAQKVSLKLSMVGVVILLLIVFFVWSSLIEPPVLKNPSGNGQKPSDPVVQAAVEPTTTLLEPLHKAMVEAAIGGPVHKSNLTPGQLDDASAAFSKYLSGILKQDGDSHFSTLEIAGVRTDYEIRGLKFDAPMSTIISEADRLNGIEARLYIGSSASAHRTKKPGGTWSEWKSGKSMFHFNVANLELKGGAWVVVSGPADHYRLPEEEKESGIFRRRADGTMEKVN